MRNLAKRLSTAALVAAALALAVDAGAQGRSNGQTGPSGGTLGGGVSGAANRGGAVGISNPSPGGEPASLGGPQQSSGPQGTEASRAGYAGGRETAPVTPPPLPPGTTIATLVESRFGDCSARASGANMDRIGTVAQYLAHPAQAHESTARYLLADLQEELGKPSPDLTLAGTYLGIASAVPLTAALVADVGNSLCAPVSEHAAQTIARVAETQRRKLTGDR
jgi:hypothetical protein